ncbi:hypothetical protein PAECIP111893_01964 [Paenibacillus plantiphilus]|uniref:DUF2313 domain-containing protein n=1 Tax=Paenibacillus plantiphilus TaxID=2905650 RepID=A0ABN8GBG4_9BACL|nr:hypothetical protein [Paenibacillus plantiphilus]CAH1203422.1 hypothetical protein PAECIP111893_01964 [Paenibacillus plantiphilus]
MQMTHNEYFMQLNMLDSIQDAPAVGKQLRSEGFTAVRRFLDDFRAYIRTYEEEQCQQAELLLQKARAALPEPGGISPSWTFIWQEFEGIMTTKRRILGEIDREQRNGEWQVLLDNQFSNQSIAVYPGLTFYEAVYMFAYFRTELVRNEYIRLQKVATVITIIGGDQSALEEG